MGLQALSVWARHVYCLVGVTRVTLRLAGLAFVCATYALAPGWLALFSFGLHLMGLRFVVHALALAM